MPSMHVYLHLVIFYDKLVGKYTSPIDASWGCVIVQPWLPGTLSEKKQDLSCRLFASGSVLLEASIIIIVQPGTLNNQF